MDSNFNKFVEEYFDFSAKNDLSYPHELYLYAKSYNLTHINNMMGHFKILYRVFMLYNKLSYVISNLYVLFSELRVELNEANAINDVDQSMTKLCTISRIIDDSLTHIYDIFNWKHVEYTSNDFTVSKTIYKSTNLRYLQLVDEFKTISNDIKHIIKLQEYLMSDSFYQHNKFIYSNMNPLYKNLDCNALSLNDIQV
jgi:hypothetical protein